MGFMSTKETKVDLSLDRDSVEHMYVEIRARTAAGYAPKEEMVLDDFRRALRKSEAGRSILKEYEDL